MPKVNSHHRLIQLLHHTFGANVELVSSKTLNESQDYLALLLELLRPHIQVIVKLAGPGCNMASDFARTAWIINQLSMRTSIPMPEIIATNMSFQDWPWRYQIKTYIPGQEFARVREQMSAAELSSAYHQVGEAVAQIHAMHFPAFGELAHDGSVLENGKFLDAFTAHTRRIIRSPRWQEAFFSVLEERQQLFEDVQQACLCHEDLHGYNILFQRQQGEWRLATILDFDKAWAGHAESDLARMQFWRGMTGPAFWEAYLAACPIASQYELRRPVYQLLWCLEYARNTKQHVMDTQQLCEQNGFPFIQGFE